jgi:hypothetical protein
VRVECQLLGKAAKYSLEIKPAAGKELDALDNALFGRIDRKSHIGFGEGHGVQPCRQGLHNIGL